MEHINGNHPNQADQHIYVFHAHWSLLVHLLSAPVLAFVVLISAYFTIGTSADYLFLRIILIVLMLSSFCVMICQFFTWRGCLLMISRDQICLYRRNGIVGEKRSFILTRNIHQVYVNQNNFFQRFFNYGTVSIYAGDTKLDFDHIGDPNGIQQLIADN